MQFLINLPLKIKYRKSKKYCGQTPVFQCIKMFIKCGNVDRFFYITDVEIF